MSVRVLSGLYSYMQECVCFCASAHLHLQRRVPTQRLNVSVRNRTQGLIVTRSRRSSDRHDMGHSRRRNESPVRQRGDAKSKSPMGARSGPYTQSNNQSQKRKVNPGVPQAKQQNWTGGSNLAAYPGASSDNWSNKSNGWHGNGATDESFSLPDITTTGRSRDEIAAEERMLLGELESAARFSYFDQMGPAAYKQPVNNSLKQKSSTRSPPKDWEAEWVAKQRVTTSEQKLRQQILKLPEAREEMPHQRKIIGRSVCVCVCVCQKERFF